MRRLLLLSTLLGAGCLDRPIGEGSIVGIVYGTITRAGTPVSGAAVSLRPLDQTTCSVRSEFVRDSVVTLANGAYRIEDWSFGGARGPFSYPVCAQLDIRFPATLALPDTTIERIDYRMYFASRDSTRIDIEIPE